MRTKALTFPQKDKNNIFLLLILVSIYRISEFDQKTFDILILRHLNTQSKT